MKEDEVPQDGGALYEGQLRRVTFAVGEDGAYKGVASKGWEAEIGATEVSRDRTNARIQAAWQQVRDGTMSPLGYHMTASLLDPMTLATEVRTWTFRVRRHLKPHVYARLSAAWKRRYAEVLGLDPAQLDVLPEAPEQV